MSAAPDLRDRYRQEFAERAPRLAGAGLPWLAARRLAAIEQFAARGLPGRKDEDWKYTDLSLLTRGPDRSPSAAVTVNAAALAPYRIEGWQLVFVDGRLAASLSALDGLPAGVEIGSLADRLRRNPEWLEARLGRGFTAARHGVAALNLAFAEDGAVIEIAPGVEPARPFQLLSVTSGAGAAPRHLRHVVVLGAQARATLIETHVALAAAPAYATAAAEVELAAGADLTHCRLVHGDAESVELDSAYVQLDRASRYHAHAVNLDGRLLRHELEIALAGEGADCSYNGLNLLAGQSHVDTQLRIEHRVPHTTSRVWARGVLDGESRGVFSGRVVVHPGAQRSDAAQTVRHLLLSPRAEADSRPQLEIYADDVKCAHGAATGSLDPDQLFYLRSRGVTEARARRILVYAFAAGALARIPDAALRRHLAERLGARLLPGEAPPELAA